MTRTDHRGDAMVRVLAGRLCGEVGGSVASSTLLESARAHRVHLLLAGLPSEDDDHSVEGAFRDEYRHAVAVDAASSALLGSILASAADAGARPLVFKGAALAHTVYERSWERPRADVDLFIAEDDAHLMRRVLAGAGYRPAVAVDGGLVTHQFQYVRESAAQLADQIDVHTRLFNPAAFIDALSWQVADARAVPVPALGPAARTLSHVDALFVACVHRVAHHYDASDLIWICDVDRLARHVPVDHWTIFADLADRARMRAVCRRGLEAAMTLFETPVPPAVLQALHSAEDEPSAAFLGGDPGELRVQWLNLRHLPGWRERASLVLQHAFPSGDYMRRRYRVASGWVLPLCYAHRMCVGVPRWLRGQRS